MGLFNSIYFDRNCIYCNHKDRVEVQYKFGHTRQLTYSIGDTICWGGNDVGKPGIQRVLVEGLSGRCGACNEWCCYEVVIELDIIIDIYQVDGEQDYGSEEGSYSIEIT